MVLFVYSISHKRFIIFTCRYFKISRNTTGLSQSNCRNFSCSSYLIRETSSCRYLSTFEFPFYAERRYKFKSKPFSISPVFISVFGILRMSLLHTLPKEAPAEPRFQGSLSLLTRGERERTLGTRPINQLREVEGRGRREGWGRKYD